MASSFQLQSILEHFKRGQMNVATIRNKSGTAVFQVIDAAARAADADIIKFSTTDKIILLWAKINCGTACTVQFQDDAGSPVLLENTIALPDNGQYSDVLFAEVAAGRDLDVATTGGNSDIDITVYWISSALVNY